MATITQDTRPADIESLAPYQPFLMYQVQMMGRPAVELSLAQMHEDQPTWDTGSMARGLARLADLAERDNLLHAVYGPEERTDDPKKAEVHLIHMPADHHDPKKPVVFCVAGGAYTCVCSIVESIPVAARLNELGYDCYVLNYRCGCDPCLPKPLDDLAAAIRHVQANKDEFDLATTDYVVCGFSAGGNVCALWGTEHVGWAAHGINKPKALFCLYPFVSFSTPTESAGGADWFRSVMLGSAATDEDVALYDIPRHFTAAYPPCFVSAAKDDPVVPVRNSEWLAELLTDKGISCKLELIDRGSHGWGDGSGTDAAGWPDRAIAWLESL